MPLQAMPAEGEEHCCQCLPTADARPDANHKYIYTYIWMPSQALPSQALPSQALPSQALHIFNDAKSLHRHCHALAGPPNQDPWQQACANAGAAPLFQRSICKTTLLAPPPQQAGWRCSLNHFLRLAEQRLSSLAMESQDGRDGK